MSPVTPGMMMVSIFIPGTPTANIIGIIVSARLRIPGRVILREINFQRVIHVFRQYSFTVCIIILPVIFIF